MSARHALLSRWRAEKRITSYASPAMSGIRTTRAPNLIAKCALDGISEKTAIEIAITKRRKLVPQRGWSVDFFRAFSTFSSWNRRYSDGMRTSEPRRTGNLRNGYFFVIAESLSFLIAMPPFGWRTAIE